MAKSPDAFRTISEVADWLDRPAHVLRFWESKFSQVKPVKRAGGRRYYRPQDMLLLGGIKKLLHDDGMTIKGVQKLLREQGVQHVASLSQPLNHADSEPGAAAAEPVSAPEPKVAESPDNLLAFKRPEPKPASEAAAPAPDDEPQQVSLFDFAPEPETIRGNAPAAAPEEDEQVAVEEAEEAAEAPRPEAQDADTQEPAAPAPASGPGILSALLSYGGKLTGAEAPPILTRAKAHADALRKASERR
ncbi:MAG: MerR family transcriptional regulator [Thalassovita sp.]|nr:MerR family transcriptional regulator [Thalassovita sp.]